MPLRMGPTGVKPQPSKHRPDALRILDFPHAAEHVSKLLEAVQEAGFPVQEQVLNRCLHILKHRGPVRFYAWQIGWRVIWLNAKASRNTWTICTSERPWCSTLPFETRAGRLVPAWWRVPTKTSSKLA